MQFVTECRGVTESRKREREIVVGYGKKVVFVRQRKKKEVGKKVALSEQSRTVEVKYQTGRESL